MEASSLLLSGMRALWGIITPNVRKVSIFEKDNLITVFFYYDKEPSEDEIELSEEAATEVIACFSEPYKIHCERSVVNYPKLINRTGFLIYARYEPSI